MKKKTSSAPRGFTTAHEVAKRAGVSRSAVSRTFTPGASVSPRTREKVTKAAAELGYRVNRFARSLISDESHLVGIVGANLSTPFMAAQLDHLSTALLRKGLQCLLLNAADAERDVAPLVAMMLEFRVRAIILMSGTPPGVIVSECLANGVPLILINRPAKGAGVIRSDDVAGAQLAADRLLRAGCRNLAVVGGDSTPSQTARADAFVTYVEGKGMRVLRSSEGPTNYDTGLLAAHRVLASRSIDGVFCVTDLLALGFLDGARLDMGRKVPTDVSVIGFDDIPQAAWSSYRLTTIVQPLEELTTAVMAALDRHDQGSSVKPVTFIPVRLVERATVRSP